MTMQEFYAGINGSYEEAKARLMNDRLIEKFVLKFEADPTMKSLVEAVEAGDIEASFIAAHTLKGVAANLAFTRLAEAAHELTEQLRPRKEAADDVLYQQVVAAYEKTINAIQALKASGV